MPKMQDGTWSVRCKGYGLREGECYNVPMGGYELCPICHAIARSDAMRGIDLMRKRDRERIRKAVEHGEDS